MTTNPSGSTVRSALTVLTTLAASSGAGAQIIKIHNPSITGYLPTSRTNVQDIRLISAEPRATYLDGSARAAAPQGMRAEAYAGSGVGFGQQARHATGVWLHSGRFDAHAVDLRLPAPGNSWWSIERDHNPRQKDGSNNWDPSDGPQGTNWFNRSVPEIVLYDDATDTNDLVVIVIGAGAYLEFARQSGGSDIYRGVNGATGAVQFVADGSGPDTYTYFDGHGNQFLFFGFDAASSPAEGQLWKKVDPAGNVAYIGHATTKSTAISSGYNGSGQVIKAYDGSARLYEYTYSGGLLTKVEVKTDPGGGYVATGYKVEYTYYTGTEQHKGLAGDLKLAKVTTPMSDSTSDVRTTYYRYYTDAFHATNNPGHAHSLRMIVESAGYHALDYAGDSTFDDDPLGETEGNLSPYASAYFKYDDDRRIVAAWFNGACGCGGGSGVGEFTFEYETQSYTNDAGYDDELVARTTVDRPDGAFEVYYFDEAYQLCAAGVADDDPDETSPAPSMWITRAIRDASDAWIDEVRTPANLGTYTHSSWTITGSTSLGLVNIFDRVSSGDTEGYIEFTQHAKSVDGGRTVYYDTKTEYTTASRTITNGGDSYTYKAAFVDLVRRYHTEVDTGTGPNNTAHYDLTDYVLTFWTGDAVLRPKTIEAKAPKVPTSENGRGTGGGDPYVQTIQYLRKDGTTAYSLEPCFSDAGNSDRLYTYTRYSGGVVTKSIRDATTNDTTDIDTANDDPWDVYQINENTSGEHLKTSYTYDGQARVNETTAPDGHVRKTHYTVLADRRLVTVAFPLVETGPEYWGPASFTVANQSGQAVAAGSIAFSGGSTVEDIEDIITETEDHVLDMVGVGSICRLTVNLTNEAGTRVEETRAYHNVPASSAGDGGGNYDATTFAYDDSGRRVRTEAADGTVTRQVFDTIGRSSSSKVGLNDYGETGTDDGSGPNDMVTTSEVVYDTGGVGNGHVTKRTAFPEAGTGNRRDTNVTYDYRGRAILTDNPAEPEATLVKVDNLGRVLATGLYSDHSGLTVTTDPTVEDDDRLALSETAYDRMGRAWKTTRHKIDVSDGSSDATLIEERWYGPGGQVLKTDGSTLVKNGYDRHWRLERQYICASVNDSTAWSDADDVSGDLVLEEHQTVYESVQSGDVVMNVRIMRFHDDLANETTGALDDNADGGTPSLLTQTAADRNGFVQIDATWYDQLHRPIVRAAYGTNGGSTFTWSSGGAPSESDTNVLVTQTVYNDDGTVLSQKDAADPPKETRFTYDDLGRVTKEIRNYVNGTPSGANGADDVTTLYTYTNGHRTKLIADIDGNGEDSGDQITEYIYGTTKGTAGSGSPPQSVIGTGNLLREVKYPEQTGGQSAADRTVYHAYNAQGQLVWMKDQNGTVHQYGYDNAARRTIDKITTFGGAVVGQTIERIQTVYDSLGRVSTVTTYDDPTAGTAKSQTERTYDGWGNLLTYEQDPDSAIGVSGRASFEITYSYGLATSSGAGGRNTVRRTGVELPGGLDVFYAYESTGNLLDADASRVTNIAITDATTDVVRYDYLGVGRVVGTDLLEPEVRWELYEGGSGGDEYPDLDRWMRTEGCQWERYGKTGADRYVYNESVIYDSAGNITSREDNIHTAGATGSGNGLFDVQYTLDGLHRLTTSDEGNWTGSAINNRTRDEVWTLDQLGNADLAKRDLDGDQNYNETNEFNDNRGFNDVNELRTRDADNSSGTTSDNYEPDYDKAGNLIDDDKRTPTGTYTYRYTYDYDGWNRLVAVRKQNGDLVAEYTYNGEGHRVSWKYDTDADNDVDGNDQTFYFGYDENWRPVVTARGTDSDMKEQFVYHAAGDDGLGGSSYIDHLFRGYRDLTNGWAGSADGVLETVTDRCHGWRPDTVVVLNAASGAVHEWAKYLSYGEPLGLAIGDANSTGTSTIGDAATIQGWAAAGPPATYDARGDMNGDNQIDGSDLSAWAVYAGGLNALSHVGNRAGYAGYQHDPALAGAFWHVRHRVLGPEGRWLQRDPFEYIDGANLYAYIASNPFAGTDPSGLCNLFAAPCASECWNLLAARMAIIAAIAACGACTGSGPAIIACWVSCGAAAAAAYAWSVSACISLQACQFAAGLRVDACNNAGVWPPGYNPPPPLPWWHPKWWGPFLVPGPILVGPIEPLPVEPLPICIGPIIVNPGPSIVSPQVAGGLVVGHE